jgi:ankyrin repeat protein
MTGPAAKFGLTRTSAHLNIAQACITYLLQFDRADPLPKNITTMFPLASYAAWSWHKHLDDSNIDIRSTLTSMSITKLFDVNTNCFQNYVRIHDLDRPDIIYGALWTVAVGLPSPLYYASCHGFTEIAQWLIENGADVNAVERGAKRALYELGNEKLVSILLKRGANINWKGGIYGYALRVAAARGHDQIVKLLLEHGADIDAVTDSDGTALVSAAQMGNESTARLLLEYGADVNGLAKGVAYPSPLWFAAHWGHTSTVKLLMQKGADVTIRCGYRQHTALEEALLQGFKSTAEVLDESLDWSKMKEWAWYRELMASSDILEC